MPMFPIFTRRFRNRQPAARYPAEPSTPPPTFRGMPELITERCLGHAACAKVCPSGALRVEHHDGGWAWELDRASCIACGLCAEACPVAAIAISPEFELASRTREVLRTRIVFGPVASEASS